MSKRKGKEKAQPSPAKKPGSDFVITSPTPPAESSGRPGPAESSYTPEDIPKGTDLQLLQKFWAAAWGKEPFKPREDSNVNYLDFKEHETAVRILCPTIPDDGKLLVLQEYVEAFSRFSDENDPYYYKGACMIGQPGIGKSCFIAYAVVERLRQRLPVAVERVQEKYWLFSTNGVSMGLDGQLLRECPGVVWAFSDSNARITIPMFAFTDTKNVRTFQVTSPKAERSKEWVKQYSFVYYYVDLPSDEDIENFSWIRGIDPTRTKALMDKCGPVLRTLQQVLCRHPRRDAGVDDETKARQEHSAEVAYETEVRQELNKDPMHIENVMTALHGSDGPAGASTIFFIRPSSAGDVVNRRNYVTFVPTKWLRDQVGKAILRYNTSERLKLYDILLGVGTSSRGV